MGNLGMQVKSVTDTIRDEIINSRSQRISQQQAINS